MQHYAILFALTALILFNGRWLYQHWWEPRLERQRLRLLTSASMQTTAQAIEDFYRDKTAYKIAKQQEKQSGEAFLYGEIDALAFLNLLASLDFAQGSFLDLGSGAGKAVLTAAASNRFVKATGAELLISLHELALAKAQALHQALKLDCEINFYCINFLQMNLAEVSVIFINAVAFRGELWNKLVFKMIDEITPGSLVIITSHLLPEPAFKLLKSQRQLMSWGLNSIRVYQKI